VTYPDHLAFVPLAERLADIARPIAKRWFGASYDYSEKPDKSPVTLADIEIEQAIRSVLATEARGHGILGEEEGGHQLDAEFVWVIDPIDGTKGVCNWETSIWDIDCLTASRSSCYRHH
jgi:fructose-1,6-bisphosphatase/inositol monophosphatase family enzyme